MTTFLLIRHATCDPVGSRIAGRARGVSLNATGRREAEALASSFRGVRVAAVYSSPLERAWETARAVAEATGVEVQLSQSLEELDFGEWTGRSFKELDDVAAWRRFNTFRSGTRIPGGEHVLEAQARAVAEIEQLRGRHAGATVAIVSHGDILRAIIAWYIGLPIDLAQRLELSPASVSVLDIGEHETRLRLLNGAGPA